MKTVVVFRKFPEGDVIALFPQMIESRNILPSKMMITSYQHVGQHSPASFILIEDLEKCEPSEYADLLKELEQIGYEDIEVWDDYFEPTYLKKWKTPKEDFGMYADIDLEEYYCFLGHHRDSDLLEESNWESFLRDHPENYDEDTKKGILVVRFGHWAVGWIEEIMVHESDWETLQELDKIRESLDGYPVYDEDDFSQRECEAQYSSVKDAIEYWWHRQEEYDCEISDDTIEKMIDNYCQNCNDNTSVPKEDEMVELYETAIHTKFCQKCYNAGRKFEFDDRHGYCGCQMKLL